MDINDYSILKPGRIVEYFPETQTATVKISNDRQFANSKGKDGQITPGLLYDVPTFTAGGGGWHMTFPIKAGDTCLLSFSQFGYDHWFVNNEDSAGVRDDGHPQPWVNRVFNLADGFAQVGWNTLRTAIADYSGADAELRNADREQRITLKEAGNIEIVAGTTTMVLSPDGTIAVDSDTSVSITSPQQTITATTKVDIVSPLVTMSGNLQVAGAIGGGGAAPTTGINMTGGGTFSADITAAGKSVATHTHLSNGNGNQTNGPT